jgi:crotonobetaine/carnitine-CoA ligase
MDAFEARFGMKLIEVYGSTELGPASAPRNAQRKPGTMGLPCPHLIVEVHDEDDNPLPPNTPGEIVARPAEPYAMALGYWNEPRATLDAFRNLWFHTGDGGYLDDEGYVVFTDRVKDSLRRRGENISSFEVERIVQRHPDVLECAAYAVPSELTEDEVMIAVVPHPDRTIDHDDVIAFCVAELPRFMVPRYVRTMDALPKTPSQRIEKYRLREQGITSDTFDREAAQR